MAENNMQVLIEGFDPSKVEAVNNFDKDWKEVYGAHQNNSIIQAPIVGIEKLLDKPCAVVSVGNIRGYIPMEFTGAANLRHLRAMTGQSVAFKVLNYDREAEVFTGSRTAALDHMAAITLKKIDVDDEIIAVVRSVSPSLVRADIGGIEVKIPLEEIRYGWIDDLTEEVKQGDHLKVKVLEINKEEKTVTVSAKALQENPWLRSIGRYTSGNEYVGTVSGVREYGVFINLEAGVDSLARHLKFQNVKKGDRVLVRVLETDAQKEQIRARITRVL
ncbi:S1 RNA-binding domain-containing protein [Saccharococcus sp. Marseille-Q5394]|uniref:S1 RNA-binding domain-containing protein n=1 Tax=Saccharococcus sp. Marseille-Q5394 TaxID=2972778 RepID=UPI0021C93211|nr:S1 RNA-binding domain-containing protein [Saccharococcus sp. Marseille-Q5394]